MAKRYRVYSPDRRMNGNTRHYLSGDRTSHRWETRAGADSYTPLQAIKKMKHVTSIVRGGGNSRLTFAIEEAE